MKKVLLVIAVVVGSAAVVRRLVPAERREQLRESLMQIPGTMMEMCMDSMPEESPPKVMVSGIRRMQEQSDEQLALLREQNKLLKKQNDLLSSALESASSAGASREG